MRKPGLLVRKWHVGQVTGSLRKASGNILAAFAGLGERQGTAVRIAFDLDDTLIPCSHAFPLEAPTRLARWLRVEPVRRGTVHLMRRLRATGCDVWVYTTSLRQPLAVRLQVLAYGIRLGGVINSDRHVRHLRRGPVEWRSCSKYPPAFNIDLLVDDLEGVVLEGRRFGFRAVRVCPADENWAARVLATVGR
jgi:hypothetical protein